MKVITDHVCCNGMTMDYFTFGEGAKPFVILPGLSLMSVIPMAPAVAVQYKDIAACYKVYLFDRKRDVEQGYTIRQMADDTARAMKALGIAGACLMGCSQGGMIAQLLAAQYPQLVSHLILCSTAARPSELGTKVIGRWVELAKAGDVVALNRDVFRRVYSQQYFDRYRDAFDYAENLGTPGDMARFVKLAQSCEGFDATAQLADIQCPVLVMGSNIDNVLSGEPSRYLAQQLNAPLVMYDDCGHAAYDEAPDYHSHILDFLSTC